MIYKMHLINSTFPFVKVGPPSGKTWAMELLKAIAFVKKDMKIAVSYKVQFIFQFLQIFFSIVVIYFVGKMINNDNWMLKKYDVDYFSFALVGLSVNSYLKTGLETITKDIRQTMNQGTLEAMCAAPINYTMLLLCSSLWQFVFETVRVTSYFVIGFVIFGMRLKDANWSGAIICLILTAPIFLMLGIISCSILIVIKRGDPINWIFSSLGALLAGTVFPVTVLPHWLQTVAFCLPLTHSLEAVRRCLFTGATLYEVSRNIWALAGFVIILIPVTIFVNRLCMSCAKKRGAFSTH
ncbi:ABC transporter permease [Planctomycetota bacterium]